MPALPLELYKENIKIDYINTGHGPNSRPFFTLSIEHTVILLGLLQFLAENSISKNLHEVVVDKTTGEHWLLVFQRVHVYENFGQLLARYCLLIWLFFKVWLRTEVHDVELDVTEISDDVTKWLLRIMSKEPQNMIDMSITYSLRQEQWRFLFLKLVD